MLWAISGGQPYTYDTVPNAWNPVPGGTISKLAVSHLGYVYGLDSNGHLNQYNFSAHTWSVLDSGITMAYLSATDDGQVYASNGSTLYQWDFTNSTWHSVATAAARIVSLAASRWFNNITNRYEIYVVTSAGGFYNSLNNGPFTPISTSGLSGTIVDVSASRDNMEVVRTSNGSVYQYVGGSYSLIGGTALLAAISSATISLPSLPEAPFSAISLITTRQ